MQEISIKAVDGNLELCICNVFQRLLFLFYWPSYLLMFTLTIFLIFLIIESLGGVLTKSGTELYSELWKDNTYVKLTLFKSNITVEIG